MIININSTPRKLPVTVRSVEDLAKHLALPEGGTAIAINGKLARKEKWSITDLQDGDNVMIISAAYGG